MTIPRIFFQSHIISPTATITGESHRYLKAVLRLREGERLFIAAFNGEFLALIAKISERETTVSIVEKIERTTTGEEGIASCRFTLAQSLLKADKMELIVQKTCELGVSVLAPFISERSISQPPLEKLETKRRRWEKISEEAARKSLRQTPMRIDAICSFSQLLSRLNNGEETSKVAKTAKVGKTADGARELEKSGMGDEAGATIKIIFWEEETALLLGDFLASAGLSPSKVKGIFFIVGPEGGFSDREVEQARLAGFHSVSLGKALLKAETAAIAASAILGYAMGRYGGLIEG